MAYSNEQSVELVKIQKNNRGDFIVVSKVTNSTSGNVSVDMRQYYTDDNDDLLPTKKGVRFSAENLLEIMKALTEALEEDEKEELSDFLNEVVEDQFMVTLPAEEGEEEYPDDFDEDLGDC